MAWGDRFYRTAATKVAARVGEPVELISMASRTGAMNAFVAGKTSSIGLGTPEGLAPRSRMKTGDGGVKGARLPTTFLVALTPTAFRVFKFRRTWFGLRIRAELGALPRERLQLETSDHGVTKQFRLVGSDRSEIRFEMNRVKFTMKFADDLSTALTAPPRPD
jgi:hypothetical protein